MHHISLICQLPSEAQYFQKGALREMEVSSIRNQQLGQGEAHASRYEPVMIEGFASKVHFTYHYPRTPVDKDLCPRGT